MNYTSIKNFGPNAVSEVNNPLTYCLTTDLDSAFMHGGQANVLRRDSRPCQLFLSEYCAQGWDNFCEIYQEQIPYKSLNEILEAFWYYCNENEDICNALMEVSI